MLKKVMPDAVGLWMVWLVGRYVGIFAAIGWVIIYALVMLVIDRLEKRRDGTAIGR